MIRTLTLSIDCVSAQLNNLSVEVFSFEYELPGYQASHSHNFQLKLIMM